MAQRSDRCLYLFGLVAMILSFDGQNTKLIKTLCIAVSQLLKIWLQRVSDTLNQSTRSYFCKPIQSHIRVNNNWSSLFEFSLWPKLLWTVGKV